MIVSHRGFWAAATLQLIIFGRIAHGSVQDEEVRQAQSPTTSIAAPSPTAGENDAEVSGAYFETTWNPFLNPTFGTPFDAIYKVTKSADAIKTQKQLTLVLLYTKAASGTPSAENIYSILSPDYSCDSGDVIGICSYDVGKTGKATLNLELNTGSSNLPAVTDNLLKNFFFCLATGVEANTQALTCESYSPFFDIRNGTDGRKRQAAGATLTTPTGVIKVVQNSDIVLKFGDQITSPSPTPKASSILIDPFPTITSLVTKVTPTATVEVTPTATAPTAVASSKKGGLPIGAIIGIAIGGFFILLAAVLILFFCFRRKRRMQDQNQTGEQVLLKDNIHNISRDVLGSEKEGSEGPMLSSILETRPSTGGPYDHLASSAPYSGPVGRPRALSSEPPAEEGYAAAGGFATAGGLIPRRNPTSATQNTAVSQRTDISRGLSEASGPISPRSTMRGDIYDDPYHDVPVYGDARHMPQVYNTQASLQAPFLSEPGMTDEELTRLEEEERRIDAAIAEAERRR